MRNSRCAKAQPIRLALSRAANTEAYVVDAVPICTRGWRRPSRFGWLARVGEAKAAQALPRLCCSLAMDLNGSRDL